MAKKHTQGTWAAVIATVTLLGAFALNSPAAAHEWNGMFVDNTTYAPGDVVKVYASAPSSHITFRLVRLGATWSQVARDQQARLVVPKQTRLGSFVEYPDVSLGGRGAFTIEGWVYPTIVGGDTVVVAGQYGSQEAAAAIIVTEDGRLAGYVSNASATNPAKLFKTGVLDFATWLDHWHHLALTYNGVAVVLYLDGREVARRVQSGAVASVAKPFRLGASADAPGDDTGVLDARLDSWAVWTRALSLAEIRNRHARGLQEVDPAPTGDDVELYVNFEGPYRSVADSVVGSHQGVIYNHGNPGVADVTGDGHAFRVNHDQLVDCHWPLTTVLRIPENAPSGMYAVEGLFAEGEEPAPLEVRLYTRSFAVRPAPGAARAPIAVVLPTNTWTAYNTWPGYYGPEVKPRRRYPGGPFHRGADNSAYNKMGDGVSSAYYHGRRRPSPEYSPKNLIDPNGGGYSIRAPASMYMVQWLDAEGLDYDVYSDDDLDLGRISATDHRVLLIHSHPEYWSDAMLDTLTLFLDAGGSAVVLGGNMLNWRVVYGANRLVEVRKFRSTVVLGQADLQSGIDGLYMGQLADAALCQGGTDYYGEPKYKAFGVMNHVTHPCSNRPFCFGRWAARSTYHWLWAGSGLADEDRFGEGRIPGYFAVGHELDTWLEGMPLPGLAAGLDPVVLAVGVDFDPSDPPGARVIVDGRPGDPVRTSCDEIQGPASGGRVPLEPGEEAGTALYFPHQGGGQVLVVGASATAWALASDASLAGLVRKALRCFALGEGCGGDPPVVRARFVPVDVGEDEGIFRVIATASDPDGGLASTRGVLALPSIENLDVKFKRKEHVKIKIKDDEVSITGPNPEALYQVVLADGGWRVTHGQQVEVERSERDAFELRLKHGLVHVKAPQFLLRVTATDTWKRETVATAQPAFAASDDDSDRDDDHDDHQHGSH